MEIDKVLIRFLVTEKSTDQRAENKYHFEVHPKANKFQIKEAVEKAFGVKVIKVATINCKPKPKRMGWYRGRTRQWKKAIVTLRPEDRIEIVEGV
ncbi:50S ribosomal protein L23 [candidate division WOR-3 bacterium]|uniref:Large ribosomal subunit protein uL23 n=1 Tax=candidate division WOR-3 bacterium TaxID=2052148 RepID=A0A660SES4_UNCW3|nr:MAG: 50S ribosomal protein L23 [candidate division WOR-3 bacterium]